MKRLDTSVAGFSEDFATLLAARGSDERSVAEPVRIILADVRSRGDEALCDYTARFDRLSLPAEKLRISAEEIASEAARVPADLMDALRTAARRIETFHAAQMPRDLDFTDEDGIRLGMRWTPLDAVGLYVPGGKAAYPSSVLMNALPARVAGVKRLAMCVPSPGGVLNPLVLAAAQLCGVEEIYRIGGAQAVGAMAFGTDLIAPVDRIVGPGNAFVAEAKRQVFGHVGIDSIAGPSEVVVVADGQNDPRLVALDLLAQAEHDEQAQAILITTDAAFADRAAEAVRKELETLPRTAIASKSWYDHGAIIVVRSLEEASEIVNALAPEHLEVMLDAPREFSDMIRHAGAIFMGRYCPEAVGDYVGGPNHVLPTSRTARFASGLSVFDFIKRTTTIEADEAGLRRIGPAGVALANAEGLDAHALSLSVRLEN
ncbi:histidinol dehydrogenase [Gluconobacter sphaericus]|uniref:Histidinol dehydrogenase n=1 Tax=Gluconobacter sphaericus NBRC 12467 TaxID=1307951 RepID=A0AA37SKP6_9PROT|nr:histidinol dehydrogenase [Gluconobacter sphaericus]MBF0886369.1 histidinol dehydrogenase [Gluconobacter sphaericus]MBS1086427.1 histidinol dehydrogenase [Gluconobacter sphaericus]MBS1100609.1 histidinol dehydrogenase [Gluconobacter sphaericus]QQX92030.1 histidinol dehydrogenase [Gluconobacter sphaericus]GBR51937.1 histidinol dehydrogenase [Gluconobacter sphaericus NBRC 12467]